VSYTLKKNYTRDELARQVLDLLAHCQHVPERDALQLRSWAVKPDEAMLSLQEIAYRILKHEDHSSARAAKQ
jgi:hypothetical protein